MKTTTITTLLLLLLFIFSCGQSTEKTSNETTQTTTVADSSYSTKEKNELNEEVSYSTYCNARYNYCLEYPTDVLTPLEESDNGDGRKFVSNNKDSEVLVWGEMNVMEESLEEKMILVIEEGGVEKKELETNYFTLSGKREGLLFFQMTKTIDEGFATLFVKYPEKRKHVCNKVIERMISSFKNAPSK